MKFTQIMLRGLTDVRLNIVGALPTDPYVLKAADGLGPPEVVVSISSTLNMGGVYQGRRPQNREITLRVGLNPSYSTGQTAEELRTELYGLLTPGFNDWVDVFIIDYNDPNGQFTKTRTKAWVKRLEVVPFSKDPEVQISLVCEKTHLEHAMGLRSIDVAGTRDPISEINEGTADTGLLINVQFTAAPPITTFVIKRSDGSEIMRLERPAGFPSGSLLHIDSRPGNRKVQLTGGGVPINEKNHAWIINPLSKWPGLHGGQNWISGTGYLSNGGSSTGWSWGAIQYLPLYWGI